ncbi:MAG: hypothetical protein AAF479_10960 [Pseudomonadota bacterium]
MDRKTLFALKARSPYLVLAAVSLAAGLRIIEPSEHEDTVIVVQAVVDGAFGSVLEIIDSYGDIAAVALAVWGYVERLFGKKDLTLSGGSA